jgi:dTDP-4-amino-4,6-dideoxygalactose transaminase
MDDVIPLFYPQIYKEEWIAALSETFSTRWLGQGPKVAEFEQAFGLKFGYDYCLGVNSGTAALELAYHLAGIKAGDEVITTVFTCTATNLPLLRRKAKIVFADIDDNLMIDPEDVNRKITRKTKAIVVVNLGGLQFDPVISLMAANRGIPVIVDACQSLGIQDLYGDLVAYSFQAIKHFTTGDGGMLVIRDEDDYHRAKKLRWFGIDREKKAAVGWRCMVGHQMAQQIEEPGYKFHMNDIAATMGMVGLKHSDEILAHRKTIAEAYRERLSESLTCIAGGAYWLFGVLTPDRESLMTRLREHGIECDQVQLRNDVFKAFGGYRQALPNMNKLESQYFYLPLHGRVTMENVEYVSGVVNG